MADQGRAGAVVNPTTSPTELERALRFAIADPGAFTPRGDDFAEPIHCWSARAVLLVLEGDESSRATLSRNRIDLKVADGAESST